MLSELDELDRALLKCIFEKPGLHIYKIIEPFLIERSESVLRSRIKALELRKLIRLEKTKREVLLFPVGGANHA